jgi:hypothetical protein
MELNFQKSILVISILIFILVLIVIGTVISKSNKKQAWPPIVGDCPDYWVDLSGNGEACLNAHSLGTCNKPGLTEQLFTKFTGKDSPGNGLANYSDVSLTQCETYCLGNKNCYGFTYGTVLGDAYGTNHCFLKGQGVATAAKTTNANLDLYIKTNNTAALNTMNFNQAPYTGNQGTCNKYKWAQNCGITWDGITSGVPNPCDA